MFQLYDLHGMALRFRVFCCLAAFLLLTNSDAAWECVCVCVRARVGKGMALYEVGYAGVCVCVRVPHTALNFTRLNPFFSL